MFLRDNRDAIPSAAAYEAAADFMSGITELQLGIQETRAILDLYPHVRIDLATCGDCTDSGVRKGLSFTAAHFFAGCAWPTYGDKVDINAFVALLQDQAVRMGYRLATATAQ